MEAKQKEIAALKEKMMEDIRREAGRVASEKHLTMIFTQYRANISAEDVTGDIAGKLSLWASRRINEKDYIT